MNTQNKLLPVALVAALLGGSVGAFVMRPSSKTTDATASNVATTAPTEAVAPAHSLTPATSATDQSATATEVASNATSSENEAYREGFAEGVRAAREEGITGRNVTQSQAASTTRVVSRRATGTRYARSNGSRQVYYDYNQPQKRSFWQKHRDKLTVAAGAGGGALLGGLIGGKKGAAIGAIAGGGGSALYTYKIRKRNRRY